MAKILDGKRVRDEILEAIRPRIANLARKPGLVVVLVGDNPASEVYVGGKVKTCAELGMVSEKLTPPATIATGELLQIVADSNAGPEIDGILVSSK